MPKMGYQSGEKGSAGVQKVPPAPIVLWGNDAPKPLVGDPPRGTFGLFQNPQNMDFDPKSMISTPFEHLMSTYGVEGIPWGGDLQREYPCTPQGAIGGEGRPPYPLGHY